MIIANDCLGGFIYQRYDIHFDNPFIWSTILTEEYIKLTKKFFNLNFNNIKIYPITKSKYYNTYAERYMLVNKNHSKQYCLLIDNTIEIAYLHYVQDEKYNEKTRIKSEIFYNNVPELIRVHYFSRLKRMDKSNVTFMFNLKGNITDNLYDFLNNVSIRKIFVAFESPIKSTENLIVIDKCKPKERVRLIARRLSDDDKKIFF